MERTPTSAAATACGAMLEALRRVAREEKLEYGSARAEPPHRPLSELEKAGSPPPAGGQSLEDAVPVERVDEEHAWLKERPCACGGRWQLSRQVQLQTPQLAPRYLVDMLEVRCASGHEGRFFFRVDTASAAYQQEQAETRRMMGLDE